MKRGAFVSIPIIRQRPLSNKGVDIDPFNVKAERIDQLTEVLADLAIHIQDSNGKVRLCCE